MKNVNELRPSNFMVKPWSSVTGTSESETVALNIMKVLSRTGDNFRPLVWEEYKDERLKDGNFTEREKGYFESVIPYCKSAEDAVRFSKSWSLNELNKS